MKYLLFECAKREFAIAFSDIKNIIINRELTPVPEYPKYVAGTCVDEDVVVPVIDSQIRFGLGSGEYDDRSCIIICYDTKDGKQREIGLLCDRVSVMKEIFDEKIEPFTAVNPEACTRYLKGVFTDGSETCYIVDVGLMVNLTDENNVFEEI